MIKLPELTTETQFFTGEVFSRKFSSALDAPRKDLPSDVWEKNKKGEDILKEGLRDEIIKRASKYLRNEFKEDYTYFVFGLYVISSIGTVFYSDTSDIDVKVVIDFDILFKLKPGLEKYHKSDIIDYLIEEIKQSPEYKAPYSKESPRDFDWYFYDKADFVELVEEGTKKFDSIYDILNRNWVKKSPTPTDLKEDGILNYALELSKSILKKFDLKLGRLNRNTFDYLYFLDYLKFVNPESQIIKSKLMTLNHDIEEILADLEIDRKHFKELRQTASDTESLEGTYAQVFRSFNFSDPNLVRKILERYGYWMILMELKKIGKDNPESPMRVSTIEEIRQVLHNG